MNDLMPLLWDQSLEIDNGEVDRDHKHLFVLSNRICRAGRQGSSKAEISQLLCEYLDFIAIHFCHEEFMMQKIGYPEAVTHIAAHNNFFERMCELIAKFERDEPDIHTLIAAFVGNYAFNHIDVYDRKLAQYCQRNHLVRATMESAGR
ncbi:MAG: bacteriohemerythrin [Azospirillum sp.]|nr:bacteriohemerythrin [Azospirillum sp.]